MYIAVFIAGFGGGAVRGIVGFLKHQFSYKNVGFHIPYFIATTFLAGIVGLLTAVAVAEAGVTILEVDFLSPGIAFVIGYAGGDFLENIYKIILKKPTIYPISPPK